MILRNQKHLLYRQRTLKNAYSLFSLLRWKAQIYRESSSAISRIGVERGGVDAGLVFSA